MQPLKPESDRASQRLGDLSQLRLIDPLQKDTPEGFTKEFADFYRIAVEFGQPAIGISPNYRRLELDSAQQRSFWILWNWWLTFRQQLEVSLEAPASGWPRHAAEGKFYELEEVSTYSDYYFVAWSLFQCEFFNTGSPFPQKELYERRIDAALHSACYHTARLCIMGVAEDVVSRNPEKTVHRRILGPQDLSGSHPSCYTGSSIDPCSWIKDASDLPFYLWDVKGRCSVEVETLVSSPSYTAISHTWGRWRTDGSTELPGVQGWRIPRNSLFDVAKLPDLLADVPVSTPYIWFDLVCIPQMRSARADKEIAKQASIFRQAVHTIIWFNGISDWSGLRLTMEWMSQVYLKEKHANPRNMLGSPTGFFEDFIYNSQVSTDDMKAVGWFSSLWTLQEICLRPDMWLCNQRWELFTVQGDVPVAFNTIVALATECQKDLNVEAASEGRHQLDMSTSFLSQNERLRSLVSQNLYPRGFVELLELFDRTGMHHLHVIKKDYILLLGSQRHCESHRAEAIMSVLDTKDWRLLPDPGALVLGLYPLEFVREVAASIGPAFFNSLSFRSMTLSALINQKLFSRGSLMPFESHNSQHAESKLLLNKEFGDEQYNSLAETWTIQTDGSVQISQAPILTSTNNADTTEIIGSIWLTYLEPDDCSDPRFDIGWPEGRRMRSCDIQKWCKTYHPSTANFAVELSRVFGASRGLLLKELSPGSRTLYKVGNYLTSIHRHYGRQVMAGVAACEQVDWIVL